MSYPMDNIGLPLKRFIDMHSSIRYESQMGQQVLDSVNSPYNTGVFHTISSQNIHNKNANSYNSNPLLKSVQENNNELSLDLEQVEKNWKQNQNSLMKSGQQSTSCLGQSYPNLNEKMYNNQEQVARISQQAQEVSDQLLIMRNLKQSLPTHYRLLRSNSKNSRINKSPSLSSASRTRAYMKPTESHKHKSIGKVTSKQRMMEAFEFLESGQKQQSVMNQKDKKQEIEKDKKKKASKSTKKSKHHQQFLQTSITLTKKNKATLKDFTKSNSFGGRPKSTKVARVPGQQRRNGKSRLFIENPLAESIYKEEKDICFERQIRVNSQGSENQITYNSLTKEQSLQQYQKCRDKYINMKNQQKSTDPRKKKQTTQDLVHQRVKQMQSKYQEVFKPNNYNKSIYNGHRESRDHHKKSVTKTPNHEMTSPRDFHFKNDPNQLKKERIQRDIRNQMGNQYMVQFKNGKSQRQSNTINSPSNHVSTIDQNEYTKSVSKVSTKNKQSKRSSVCTNNNEKSIQKQKINNVEVQQPSIIEQNPRTNTMNNYYNEDNVILSEEYQKRLQKFNRSSNVSQLQNQALIAEQNMLQKPIQVYQKSTNHYSRQTSPPSPENQQVLKLSFHKSPRKPQIIQEEETQQHRKNKEEEKKLNIMQKRLKFLHIKLGAILKGYKTRRIFHNHPQIRKIRLEFREIIQFAYTLKKDIEDESIEQSKELKHLLVTSLKELMSKRLIFSNVFQNLLNHQGGKVVDWIIECHPRQIQQLEYNYVFLNKERQSSKTRLTEQSQGRRDTRQSKNQRSNSQENKHQIQNQYVKESYISVQEKHQPESNYLDTSSSINKSKKYSSSQQRFRRLVGFEQIERISPKQMTFGHNSIQQSRNMSFSHNLEQGNSTNKNNTQDQELPKQTTVQSPIRKFQVTQEESKKNLSGSHRSNQEEKSKKQINSDVKHSYLRKGSNSRQKYDPKKSIELEKEFKKQKKIQQMMKEQEEQKNMEQPQSPRIILEEVEEQPNIVQIRPNQNSTDKKRPAKFISTPIKDRNSETMEKVSAKRLSDLRYKYKTAQQTQYSNVKAFNPVEKAPPQTEFISKIPRLSCSIERLNQQTSTTDLPIQMKESQKNFYQKKIQVYTNNKEIKLRRREQNHSIVEEENNYSRLSSLNKEQNLYIQNIHSKSNKELMNKSHQSNSTSVIIPVVSPCIKVNINEEKDSSFKVQINKSFDVSEIVSRLQSPQIRGSIPIENKVNENDISVNENRKNSMSPIKGILNLDTDRSQKMKEKEASPAVSIGKHMDEILRRCTNLNQSQFQNNYLNLGIENIESNEMEIKSSIRSDKENLIQEIQLFSPQPQPDQLKINMVNMDQIPKPSIISSVSSFQDTKQMNQMMVSKEQYIKDHENFECSNQKEFNYKLGIMGHHNGNQRNQIEMFDMISNMDSTQRDILSAQFRSNPMLSNMNTVNTGQTQNSSRQKPFEFVQRGFQNETESRRKETNQSLSPHRKAYSPGKSKNNVLNKENLENLQSLQNPEIIHQTKEPTSRRRSRGERVKRSSQNRCTQKPLSVLQIQNDTREFIKQIDQSLNQTNSSFNTPSKNNRGCNQKKYEKLGLVKRSNQKSPNCSILDQRNNQRSSNSKKQVISRYQRSFNQRDDRHLTNDCFGTSLKQQQNDFILIENDQPLNIDLKQLCARLL